MEMLTEIDAVRQYPGERKRRWFTSPEMDLFVWMGRGQAPVKFQLCYDKDQNEKALTWSKAGGYTHENVDPGEPVGLGYKKAAVLVSIQPAPGNGGACVRRHQSRHWAAPIQSAGPAQGERAMDDVLPRPQHRQDPAVRRYRTLEEGTQGGNQAIERKTRATRVQ